MKNLIFVFFAICAVQALALPVEDADTTNKLPEVAVATTEPALTEGATQTSDEKKTTTITAAKKDREVAIKAADGKSKDGNDSNDHDDTDEDGISMEGSFEVVICTDNSDEPSLVDGDGNTVENVNGKSDKESKFASFLHFLSFTRIFREIFCMQPPPPPSDAKLDSKTGAMPADAPKIEKTTESSVAVSPAPSTTASNAEPTTVLAEQPKTVVPEVAAIAA